MAKVRSLWVDAGQKYLSPAKGEQEEKEKEGKKVEEKRMLDEVTLVLKEMQAQNAELKDAVKGALGQSTSSPHIGSKAASVTEQLQKIEIAELKADIKKLKAMMLDSKSSTSYQPTNTLGWSPSEPKLPAWMEKDSGKTPLSFDDPYSRMLEKAQNRGNTGEGSSTTTLEEGKRDRGLLFFDLSRTKTEGVWENLANGAKRADPRRRQVHQ